jgi:F0F1-type ATP synthase membrane subunit b/b'
VSDGPHHEHAAGEAPSERPPSRRSAGPAPDAEPLVRRVLDLVSGARPMPLSASVMINRDEVVELLEESLDRMPDELRAARWLLKEREEFLAKVRREGEDILEQARARAERMVQRTEVVKAAEQRARRIVDAAEAESRRLKNECEDYCDQKLGSFEIVLERTLKMVHAGRQKLQGNLNTGEVPAVAAGEIAGAEDTDGSNQAFFDQDNA